MTFKVKCLLAGSFAVYTWMASRPFLSQASHVYLFLLLMAVAFGLYLGLIHQKETFKVKTILIWAVILRIPMLWVGLPISEWRTDMFGDEVVAQEFLLYDNDIWRFMWDGQLTSHGVPVYQVSPESVDSEEHPQSDALTEGRWDDILFRVSYPSVCSVYPPVAQLLFRIHHFLTPGSVLGFRVLLLLIDLGVIWILSLVLKGLAKDPKQTIWYAFNPLVIKEFVGSTHFDGLMILFVLTALVAFQKKNWLWCGALFATAVATKLSALFLVPLIFFAAPFRTWLTAAGVGLAWFLGYWSQIPDWLANMKFFADNWVFNPGPWAFFQYLGSFIGFQSLGKTVSWLVLLASYGLIWKQKLNWEKGLYCALAAFLLFQPTVMPWYTIWVLPLACLAQKREWLWIMMCSLFSYLIYIDQIEHDWVLISEYVLMAAILGWFYVKRR